MNTWSTVYYVRCSHKTCDSASLFAADSYGRLLPGGDPSLSAPCRMLADGRIYCLDFGLCVSASAFLERYHDLTLLGLPAGSEAVYEAACTGGEVFVGTTVADFGQSCCRETERESERDQIMLKE